MRRVIVVFLICVGCLGSGGCQTLTLEHGYTHPHSAVTAPTFCFYEGRDEHSQPIPIYEIIVARQEKISGDERFEWDNWRSWRKGRYYADQVTWEIQYVPDDHDQALTKPLSCITYGKAPPGYDEKIPAVPLIPERLYAVLLETQEVTARGGVYFIIRLDLAGHPTQLEYTIKPTRLDQIREITQE